MATNDQYTFVFSDGSQPDTHQHEIMFADFKLTIRSNEVMLFADQATKTIDAVALKKHLLELLEKNKINLENSEVRFGAEAKKMLSPKNRNKFVNYLRT